MSATKPLETITGDRLLQLRMRALGLTGRAPGAAGAAADAGRGGGAVPGGARAGSGPARIAATARRMLALQGQDWRASRWALGLRTPGTTVADVHAAFDSGLIVRSWPMRGTVHVTTAEDIGWMQRALAKKPLAGAARRREFLGISDETLDRLVEVSLDALAGLAARGTGLTRDALAQTWTEAGIEWQRNWRYHVVWWLCQNGLAVFGPTASNPADLDSDSAGSDGPGPGPGDTNAAEPLLVLADEWIQSPRQFDGDEALAELAACHASARGPVRDRDLAWWTGLGVRDARRGLSLAEEQGRLVRVQLADIGEPVDDKNGVLWADPEQLDEAGTHAESTSADGPEWQLLPAFDEHLLGFTERDAQLDPAHFERIVPGRNGMFMATVVRGGRTVGTWKRSAKKAGGLIITALPGCAVELEALRPAAAEWGAFHEVDGEVPLTLA